MAEVRGHELHALAADRLRAIGQRFTGNRRAIVDVLSEARQPLTIPDVLAARSGLAQSSVYRGMAVLEEAGVVRRIVTTTEFARYELVEDLTGHHHHLICSSCGAVQDFVAPESLERTMASALGEVAAASGFAADHHRLDLVGRCKTCA